MLHNNRAFASNEAPVNIGAPVNNTPMGAPILPHNFADISPNPQANASTSASSYDATNHIAHRHQEHSLGAEMHPYTPFQNFHFDASQAGMNPHNFHELGIDKLQNFLMSGPDIHSNNAMNFSNVYTKPAIPSSCEVQMQMDKNAHLNIPQIHTKAFHKQVGMPVHNQINFNDNLPFYSEEFRNSKPKPVFSTIQEMKQESQSSISNGDLKENSNSQISDERPETQSSVSKSQTATVNIVQDTQSTISKSLTTGSNSSYKETSDTRTQLQDPIENKPLNNSLHEVEVKVEVEQVWLEQNYENPFVNDMNGVKHNAAVENSLARAIIDVQNESNYTTYKCDLCDLLFCHPKRFLIHYKWHSFCAKDEEVLIKSEEMSGEHECKDCNKFFTSKFKLKNHRFRFHSGNRKCTVCDITLSSWRDLKEHTESMHMDGNSYKCNECHKVFKHRHTLARHSKVHGEKTIPCDLCPKMFGSPVLVKQHMKSHERAERGPSHHCSFCGRGFHEAYHLQVHERGHRNEKPYVCEICNATYSTNSSLQRHLKVSHNNTSKPYECSVCHRFFVSENIKDRHEIRYHESEAKLKYSCEKCDEKFVKSKDLSKHMYSVHPKSRKRRSNDSD